MCTDDVLCVESVLTIRSLLHPQARFHHTETRGKLVGQEGGASGALLAVPSVNFLTENGTILRRHGHSRFWEYVCNSMLHDMYLDILTSLTQAKGLHKFLCCEDCHEHE